MQSESIAQNDEWQLFGNFIPEENISIDESMVPYYGHHGWKQYIQSKPVKFVYKLWVAATPLGYGIKFYPYAGKDDNYNKDTGLGGSVVMTLISKLPAVPILITMQLWIISLPV